MTFQIRLLQAVESQQRETFRTLIMREEAERNRTAYQARVLGYNPDEDLVTVALDGGAGVTKGTPLTNANLRTGQVVGFFRAGDGDGFIDAPSLS